MQCTELHDQLDQEMKKKEEELKRKEEAAADKQRQEAAARRATQVREGLKPGPPFPTHPARVHVMR